MSDGPKWGGVLSRVVSRVHKPPLLPFSSKLTQTIAFYISLESMEPFDDMAPTPILININSRPNIWEPGDDWAGVTNQSQRKKLQNRLNQRAYRQSILADFAEQLLFKLK